METILEPIPFTDEDGFIPGLQIYGYCDESVHEIKTINGEVKAFNKNGDELIIHRIQ